MFVGFSFPFSVLHSVAQTHTFPGLWGRQVWGWRDKQVTAMAKGETETQAVLSCAAPPREGKEAR